jgi:hypothetical protein
MSNLKQAHHQWASRPADERFASIEALYAAACAQRASSKAAKASWSDLEVGLDAAGDPVLASASGGWARLNNWSFGQLASKAGAPVGYLSRLPGELAAECLNHGLAAARAGGGAGEARLLVDQVEDGAPLVRAMTSPEYKRVWNAELVERLLNLPGGWKLPLQYENGNWDGPLVPGGAYMGDRDLFVFMIDESKRIADGTAEGLSRGFFLWNSEVGAKSFGLATFLYRHVCGNNIVWGASDYREFRVRHVGAAPTKVFEAVGPALIEYANASALDDEAAIARARTLLLGADREETVGRVVDLVECSRRLANDAYMLAGAYSDVDGAPNTVWGMVNGMTRAAQLSKWTDDRVDTDRAAARLFTKALA